MKLFHNDYNETCHPQVMDRILRASKDPMPGYGTDEYCQKAANEIRRLCENDRLSIHFLVGGTQTNLTVIAASLRPHQAVISAVTGHINVHETGAIEATGHKVIAVPSDDGKLTACQVEKILLDHRNDSDREHTVQPKLVYISNPTEVGTIYTKEELTSLSGVCKRYDVGLYLDGARLGYGLTASDNDLTFADLASLCDMFYIGGTKVGAMFGEAVVISNPGIAEDFRYLIKQRGGMLAKGWLLGVQFLALLENDLYFQISRHANAMADKIRSTVRQVGCPVLAENTTNQVFPILSDVLLEKLSEEFTFCEFGRVDESHRAVRFCTSWATREEDVDALCRRLEQLSK